MKITGLMPMMRAKVKDKARICDNIETFEWGRREFAVFDNNGYILQFGQEIADQ